MHSPSWQQAQCTWEKSNMRNKHGSIVCKLQQTKEKEEGAQQLLGWLTTEGWVLRLAVLAWTHTHTHVQMYTSYGHTNVQIIHLYKHECTNINRYTSCVHTHTHLYEHLHVLCPMYTSVWIWMQDIWRIFNVQLLAGEDLKKKKASKKIFLWKSANRS